MIEAFEIGVSLALRDGVSDGIAAARRDMVAIEASIGTSRVSLETLRRTGQRLLASTGATAATGAVQGGFLPTPVKTSATQTERHAETKSHDGPQSSPVLPPKLAVPVAEVRTRRSTDSSAPVTIAATPQPAIMNAGTPAVAARTKTTSDALAISAAMCGAAIASTLPAKQENIVGQTADLDGARLSPNSGPKFQLTFPAPAPTITQSPFATVPIKPSNLKYDRPAVGAQSQFLASTGSVAPSVNTIAAAVPPASPEAMRVGTGTLPERPSPSIQLPVQQSSTQGDAPPVAGDIFLDGTLVGRWMCRFLTREAARDPAGPTGFDPRRNSILPGPTTGL